VLNPVSISEMHSEDKYPEQEELGPPEIDEGAVSSAAWERPSVQMAEQTDQLFVSCGDDKLAGGERDS